MSSLNHAVSAKLSILSSGVRFHPDFLKSYGEDSTRIEKRRAYGTGDTIPIGVGVKIPQEIIISGKVMAPANHQSDSPWEVIGTASEAYLSRENERFAITFPSRPRCYDSKLSSGEDLKRVATIYGDSTIGLFSPGHCYYFNTDSECRFCSLGPARKSVSDHRMSIRPALASEAVGIAVALEPERFKRVLLNGGTLPDYDQGFQMHLEILREISRSHPGGTIERHLISMPPSDLSLLREFPSIANSLAMSLEIYDKNLFESICPGKARDYGRSRFIDAFKAAVDIIGRGNVYAGFVAGLEPAESLIEGMTFFAEMGVVPAVAVFHPDDGSKFSEMARPSIDFLRHIGLAQSALYKQFGFRPLIEGSGRNSLDTEAFLQGFSND